MEKDNNPKYSFSKRPGFYLFGFSIENQESGVEFCLHNINLDASKLVLMPIPGYELLVRFRTRRYELEGKVFSAKDRQNIRRMFWMKAWLEGRTI